MNFTVFGEMSSRLRNPVPDRSELLKVAIAGGQSVELLAVVAGDIPFRRVRRRVSGIVADVVTIAGCDFYDYVASLAEGDVKGLAETLGRNGSLGNVDCVLLEQIVGCYSFPPLIESRSTETRVMNAADNATLYETFQRHKKLVKQIRRAQRKLSLKVETTNDREAICRVLPSVAAMHAERWHFDGVSSAFNQAVRIKQYEAASGRALVTKVMAGEELFAIHYGLVFDNVLLWHTPVINLAFLEHSPLQTLFGYVVEACDKWGISTIDFGLGDEDYKARFATATRSVREFIIPLTLKGRLLALVRKNVDTEGLNAMYSSGRDVARRVKGGVCQYFNRVRYFQAPPRAARGVQPAGYREIENWHDLVNLLRRSGIEIRRHQYDRIRGKQRFVCIEQNGGAVCYGWIWNKDEPFLVGETGENISAGVTVLFDFVTPERHRRRGYYSSLLQAIALARPSDLLQIFASADNKASIAGIRRAGYVECHRL